MPDDVAYWIALSRLPGIGPVVFRRLCDRFGDPENVFHAPAAEVGEAAGLRSETVDALRHPVRHLEAAREMAAAVVRGGFAVLTFRDADYPAPLHDLHNPPPILYTLGRLPSAQDRAFSVAGSTHPSRRGADISRASGRTLAEVQAAQRAQVPARRFGIRAALATGQWQGPAGIPIRYRGRSKNSPRDRKGLRCRQTSLRKSCFPDRKTQPCLKMIEESDRAEDDDEHFDWASEFDFANQMTSDNVSFPTLVGPFRFAKHLEMSLVIHDFSR